MKGAFRFPYRLFLEDEHDTLGFQISAFIEGKSPWVIPYSSILDQDPMPDLYACMECVNGRVLFKWKEKIFSTVEAKCNRCGQDYVITSVP